MSVHLVTPLFLGASFLVIAVPGPDAALLASMVLRDGRRRPAFAAATGMITAGAGHALLALTGAALLLRAHPGLLTALRWAGALVMLGWGVQALRTAARARRSRGSANSPAQQEGSLPSGVARLSLRRAWLQGVGCTGSNPKVALFLLAYLPQFVPPSASPASAMAVLSAVYLSLVAVWLSALVIALSAVRTRVARHSAARRVRAELLEALLGAVFICFAVRLAWG